MTCSLENFTGPMREYFKRLAFNDHSVLYNIHAGSRQRGEMAMMKTSPPEGEATERRPVSSQLDSLEKEVAGCNGCTLHTTRNNTVFGSGNPSSPIVFIGEAPGRDEDLQGVPFVGRAGKLLDKILEAIGFGRDDIYIANILKCRPPGNRDPKEEEVEACERFLVSQIRSIDPVLICALGRVAAQNLLKTKASLKSLREGVHYYEGIRVIVTYHPAALLRNPAYKRPTWDDMKLLRSLYDEDSGSR